MAEVFYCIKTLGPCVYSVHMSHALHKQKYARKRSMMLSSLTLKTFPRLFPEKFSYHVARRSNFTPVTTETIRNFHNQICTRKRGPISPRVLTLTYCGSTHFQSISRLSLSYPTMVKTALVIIANGSEEIEAVTPIDTLRRAGVEVTVAGLKGAGETMMSRKVILWADKSLQDALLARPYDAVILPGGLGGAEAFAKSEEVGVLLKEQEEAGRLVAAICAAPTALHQHNIGLGKAITSYPSTKEKMIVGDKYQYKEDRVVVDGNLITSRGPGTSLEFSLAVAAYLVGQEKADEVGKGMLFK